MGYRHLIRAALVALTVCAAATAAAAARAKDSEGGGSLTSEGLQAACDADEPYPQRAFQSANPGPDSFLCITGVLW
jgi:hypothetical protein